MSKTKVFDEALKVKHNVFTPIYQAKEVDELPENPKLGVMYRIKYGSDEIRYYHSKEAKLYNITYKNEYFLTKLVLNRAFCERFMSHLNSIPEEEIEDAYIYMIQEYGDKDYLINFGKDRISYYSTDTNTGDTIEEYDLYADGIWFNDTINFNHEDYIYADEVYIANLMPDIEYEEHINKLASKVIVTLDNASVFSDLYNKKELELSILNNKIELLRSYMALTTDPRIIDVSWIKDDEYYIDFSNLAQNIDFSKIPMSMLENNLDWESPYIDGTMPYAYYIGINLSNLFANTKGINSNVIRLFGEWVIPQLDEEDFSHAINRPTFILDSCFQDSDIEEFDFTDLLGERHIIDDNYNKRINLSMNYMFAYCEKLKTVKNLFIPSYKGQLRNTSIHAMFASCSNLTNLECIYIYGCRLDLSSLKLLTDTSLINVARALILISANGNSWEIVLSNSHIDKIKNEIFVRFVDPDVTEVEEKTTGEDIERCSSTDERAMSLYSYIREVKKWRII